MVFGLYGIRPGPGQPPQPEFIRDLRVPRVGAEGGAGTVQVTIEGVGQLGKRRLRHGCDCLSRIDGLVEVAGKIVPAHPVCRSARNGTRRGAGKFVWGAQPPISRVARPGSRSARTGTRSSLWFKEFSRRKSASQLHSPDRSYGNVAGLTSLHARPGFIATAELFASQARAGTVMCRGVWAQPPPASQCTVCRPRAGEGIAR